MSGPARKKTGELPAYWAEGQEAEAARQAVKPYLDRIKSKLPPLAEKPGAMATIQRILEAYMRNRPQPEAGSDHRAVMKRREGMIAASHDLMERMAAVIEDGAPASLARAYDALAFAIVEVQQDPPEGYAESEAKARDAALVALMDLAEAHGIEPEKMALSCDLIEYKTEDQFTRALSRARQTFSRT